MKPGGGRAKGAAFERDVSKIIVAAFEDKGITQKDCYRTPLSGGHRFASKTDPGDLVMSRKLWKMFPFSVECKCVKKVDWHRLMRSTRSKGHWSEWWKQSVVAAAAATGEVKTGYTITKPLVVFRENGSPTYVMFHVWLKCDRLPTPYISAKLGGERVIVMRFNAFLKIIKTWRAAKR